MSDKLKKFINDNRQEFDNSQPSSNVWEKIDSRIENKTSHWIKSKWLGYFAFGASAIVLTSYLIFRIIGTNQEKELAMSKMEGTAKTTGNLPEISTANSGDGKEQNPEVDGNIPQITLLASSEVKQPEAKTDSIRTKTDSVFHRAENQVHVVSSEAEKAGVNSTVEKKESNSETKIKKRGIYIPEEPVKVNSYSGTLYDASSLCAVLRAYKFPGKVDMDRAGNYTDHRIMKTTSCSHLENMTNIKAVWLKGKTDKELTLPVKSGFKNIVLVKSDGRELNPEAISHYYTGLGVISGYEGKYLNMIYKNKVELILFFKDAEEGDKVVIDGIIEAVVKNKP